MKQEGNSATQARYLRKHLKEGGVDEDEEHEDQNFKEDLEKALKNHSRNTFSKDLEKQVQYFGYKLEPFNMKEEQEMGEVDEEGFFVMNDKRRVRDPWLDSLNQEGQEAIDTLRKKIKTEQREMTVHDGDRKVKERYNSDQEDNEDPQAIPEEEEQQIEEQNKMKPKQFKILLAELLPFNTNANQYMKKLKKQKNTELYDKILFLCNEYIAASGQHDILTQKKEDMEEQIEQDEQKNGKQEEEPIKNWDNDSQSQKDDPKKKVNEGNHESDQDNIF